MEVIAILILAGLFIFNIVFYIPYLLKKQEEKLSLHFQEIQMRLNRLDKSIQETKNRSEN
ncbi:hypothetical protein [Clostridium nigeriense]|uniref:hypothetical protein n=1 Tax=Clostridium nigeriense TaxID=1805470 RepID=UPI000B104944|nr:hypothetical protein [Clostridium nigeriense]